MSMRSDELDLASQTITPEFSANEVMTEYGRELPATGKKPDWCIITRDAVGSCSAAVNILKLSGST